jgi:hypothetical protein
MPPPLSRPHMWCPDEAATTAGSGSVLLSVRERWLSHPRFGKRAVGVGMERFGRALSETRCFMGRCSIACKALYYIVQRLLDISVTVQNIVPPEASFSTLCGPNSSIHN